MNYEQKERKRKIIKELGYGIMWLFLSTILEVFFYLGIIRLNFYHFVAAAMFLAAIYKFWKAVEQKKKFKDQL